MFIPLNAEKPLYFVEVQFRYDAKIYANLLAKVYVYLNQNNPAQDWRGVIIFGNRNFEPSQRIPYQEVLESGRVARIYLDEFPQDTPDSLGIGIIQFIASSEEMAIPLGKRLLTQTRTEVTDAATQAELIGFLDTLFI